MICNSWKALQVHLEPLVFHFSMCLPKHSALRAEQTFKLWNDNPNLFTTYICHCLIDHHVVSKCVSDATMQDVYSKNLQVNHRTKAKNVFSQTFQDVMQDDFSIIGTDITFNSICNTIQNPLNSTLSLSLKSTTFYLHSTSTLFNSYGLFVFDCACQERKELFWNATFASLQVQKCLWKLWPEQVAFIFFKRKNVPTKLSRFHFFVLHPFPVMSQ